MTLAFKIYYWLALLDYKMGLWCNVKMNFHVTVSLYFLVIAGHQMCYNIFMLSKDWLFPWYLIYIIGECRTLTQESCDISPVLTQAMEALQDRPVLYKYVHIHSSFSWGWGLLFFSCWTCFFSLHHLKSTRWWAVSFASKFNKGKFWFFWTFSDTFLQCTEISWIICKLNINLQNINFRIKCYINYTFIQSNVNECFSPKGLFWWLIASKSLLRLDAVHNFFKCCFCKKRK